MRGAFTLIELVIVLGIIALLSGLAMPMVSVAQRQAKRTQTEAILQQTDSALRLFKEEYGAYPYQGAYPDLQAGQSFDSVPNQLGYALGTDLSLADRATVQADMTAAGCAYAYAINPVSQQENPQSSAITYTKADVLAAGVPVSSPIAGAIVLNRMGQERARLAVMAGDVQLRGPLLLTPAGAIAADRSLSTVLSAPHSSARPGWASNYLEGQIDPRFLHGSTICDAWGHGLVYICQVIPGIHGTTLWALGGNIIPFDTRYEGLGAQGFDPTTGPAAALKASDRGLLLGCGRIRLDPADAGDGQPPPADPSYLPDPSVLLHSDVRYSAAPGFELEFELWSAGPDGQFAYLRDAADNRDNIAVQPYTKGL